MYPKGGNMLHTIRQIVNDDAQWRSILRGLNKTFYHQTVTTKQIEDYVSQGAKRDLSKVFDQYLRDIRVPVLEYRLSKRRVEYRWTNCVSGFDMPVKILLDNAREMNVIPKTDWQKLKTKRVGALAVNKNYYVLSKEITK